jgi:hypothetical protein
MRTAPGPCAAPHASHWEEERCHLTVVAQDKAVAVAVPLHGAFNFFGQFGNFVRRFIFLYNLNLS